VAAFESPRAAITIKETVFRVFIQEKMKHLHTGQFKQVYKEVKTPLPHLNFLILGFLVWLEQLYLDYTIKANIDSAIDDYHKQMDRLKK
jgi:hypothetical protein